MRALAPLLILVSLSGCTNLFFFPDRHVYVQPERFGVHYDIVHFPSKDGTDLEGIFMHSRVTPVKGTVIHFHGNAQNLSSHFGYSYWLNHYGYQVFIFDYRGYGGSKGNPTQEGAVQDGIAAIEYLRTRPDVDRDRIAVWGQSLGGAISIASLGLLKDKSGIRAFILEDTFDSYRSIARDVLSRHWITWPLQWMPWLVISERHKPTKYLDRLPPCPVLVIHGDADKIVPYWLGQRLYQELREPKEFWTVHGGGHVEAFTRFETQFKPRLVEYLDKNVAR